MNYKLNFQKAKRNYMTLTFDDEREIKVEGETVTEEYERTICVGMPKKRIFSAMLDMQDILDKREDAQTRTEKNEATRELIDEMYELVAKILSNNLKRERITTEWVEEQFSIEELQTFFRQYTKFAKGEAADPN